MGETPNFIGQQNREVYTLAFLSNTGITLSLRCRGERHEWNAAPLDLFRITEKVKYLVEVYPESIMTRDEKGDVRFIMQLECVVAPMA